MSVANEPSEHLGESRTLALVNKRNTLWVGVQVLSEASNLNLCHMANVGFGATPHV